MLAHDRLSLARDDRLWSLIQAVPSWDFVDGVAYYTDEGLDDENTDAYGEPLRFVRAGDLARVTLPTDTHPWNRAVLAFVSTLPTDTRIVLYWC